MQRSMRFVIAGVTLGAVLGAVAALVYARAARPEEHQEPPVELGASRIARLGLLVLGTVREILSLT